MSITERSHSTEQLLTEVQFVKGVGPKNAALFAKAGIHTVADLLWTLPRRYEDRTNLPKIRDLKGGTYATVRGRIIGIEGRPTRGGKVILKAALDDGSGSISLVWFNQPWVKTKLQNFNGEVIAYGFVKEVGWSHEMHSPEFELLGDDDDPADFARIVPVYGLTEGLRQSTFRKAVQAAIEKYVPGLPEPLPVWLLKQHRMKALPWCLRHVHAPESEQTSLDARRRLVFEEFLYLQLSLEKRRRRMHAETGIAFPISNLGTAELSRPAGLEPNRLFVKETAGVAPGENLWDEVGRLFPFKLTEAQKRVINEIWLDMERPHPMNRLVQGDVGSGKTAVAACAMLAAVRCGYQAAFMAPTEILAEQHARNLKRIFEPVGIEVALLVGKQTARQKKDVIAASKTCAAHILVGTHALIQESVEFNRLGLIVIDEQHRFGVVQRAALHSKAVGNPDVLVMTATPIPRTLEMTVHGDLDVSRIDELPPGRLPITTRWRPLSERQKTYEQVREMLNDGAQVYVVCPMVSESEKLQVQAAEELYKRLSEEVFPEFKVALLHGQMKARDKESVMESFRSGDAQILVSTTVIEVGVDVPNASAMIIEDANRFGLAQLHQLRGRVGRGSRKSFCLLLADTRSEDSETRMSVMVATQDGFEIAQKDLEIRGAGDLLGTKQSGFADMKVADLVRDAAQLEVARKAAMEILEADPELREPENRALRERSDQVDREKLAPLYA